MTHLDLYMWPNRMSFLDLSNRTRHGLALTLRLCFASRRTLRCSSAPDLRWHVCPQCAPSAVKPTSAVSGWLCIMARASDISSCPLDQGAVPAYRGMGPAIQDASWSTPAVAWEVRTCQTATPSCSLVRVLDSTDSMSCACRYKTCMCTKNHEVPLQSRQL